MTELTFIQRVLMINGVGQDYISAWFAMAKCEEVNDPLQIQKMIKTMVKIEHDYSHLKKQDLRTARISELSKETGLTVKLLGRAIGSFGLHYRLGELSQIFNQVFGFPLNLKEVLTNTLVHYIEGISTTLFEEGSDEVSVTIRTVDGREFTFTMRAGEALLFK